MTEPRTLLKREESYAVHALLDIAQHPGTSSAEIAARLQLPPAFTAKVMRKLVKAGFVASQVGRSGGLSLKVDLARTTMLDAIEGVSGPLTLDTCQSKPQCATQERLGRCGLKMAWLATTVRIRDALAEVTLADLLPRPADAGADAAVTPPRPTA